jgi:hypothetical protein
MTTLATTMPTKTDPQSRLGSTRHSSEDCGRELRVQAALAEYGAVRQEILFKMDKAHRLATYGIGAAGALLTASAGFGLHVGDLVTIAAALAFGLGVIALTYIGIVGEELQASDYLRGVGALIRDLLRSPELPDIGPDSPLLRYEDAMATRTRARSWIVFTSSLAALELLASVLAACGLLAWAQLTYLSDPAAQTISSALVIGCDYVLAATAIGAAVVILVIQHRRRDSVSSARPQ